MRGSSWRASSRSLSGSLVVAFGVRGPGASGSAAGRRSAAVLLPQPGAGGVQRRRPGRSAAGPGPGPRPGTPRWRPRPRGWPACGRCLPAGRRLCAVACRSRWAAIAGGPAQHGGVVAAGDVAAVVGVCLVRGVGFGPGPLDFGGRSAVADCWCRSSARWWAAIAARRRSLAAWSAASISRRMPAGTMSCQRPARRPGMPVPRLRDGWAGPGRGRSCWLRRSGAGREVVKSGRARGLRSPLRSPERIARRASASPSLPA